MGQRPKSEGSFFFLRVKLNENENRIYQNVLDEAKTMPREFMILSDYITKEGKS